MFDIKIANQYMTENCIDAWIIYDFRSINQVAHAVLGKTPASSRRYFLIIEKGGEIVLVCNILDKPQFDFCSFSKVFYTKSEDLISILRQYLNKYRAVITEYSPNASIPTMSIIDAGTFELFSTINNKLTILSSADCYQLACGSWSKESLARHLEACKDVIEIKNIAFDYLIENIKNNRRITEYDVQKLILDEFERRGMITEDVPVVAVNKNSSDPHYEPSETEYSVIREGDWVLIDLWAKYPEEYAVFGDITWVGFMGNKVPEKYVEIFNIVKEMRDSVVAFLTNCWENNISIEGWQADEEARKVARKYNLEKYFIHRTGHSIAPGNVLHSLTVNLDNYETRDTRKILPGIGFSVEPGIYLPEFGVRSEINVYIDVDKGPIVTTDLQNDIITFENIRH